MEPKPDPPTESVDEPETLDAWGLRHTDLVACTLAEDVEIGITTYEDDPLNW